MMTKMVWQSGGYDLQKRFLNANWANLKFDENSKSLESRRYEQHHSSVLRQTSKAPHYFHAPHKKSC